MGLVGAENLEIAFALIGGLLMCIATSFNLWMKGRITGNSGYLSALIRWDKPSVHFRIAFVLGIWTASTILFLIQKHKKVDGQANFFDEPEQMVGGLSIFGFALAGYLVGFGTSLGNGCTSGHGVCGLPRFSLRSYVAVGCFMLLGMGLGTLRHHEPFLDNTQSEDLVEDVDFEASNAVFLGIAILGILATLVFVRKNRAKVEDVLVTYAVGFVFSIGLVISGMCKRSAILGFLAIHSDWNPSLIFVMAAAAGGNFFTFYYIIKVKQKPILAEKFGFPAKNGPVTMKLIIGECLFGLGWGLGGMCPGPAIALFPFMSLHISLVFLLCLFAGIYSAHYGAQYFENKSKQVKLDDSSQKQQNHHSQQIDENLQAKLSENEEQEKSNNDNDYNVIKVAQNSSDNTSLQKQI